MPQQEGDRRDFKASLHFLRNRSQGKVLTKNVGCFMAHTLLSDCCRDVGMGTAWETGQGDRTGSPVLSPHYISLGPGQNLHSVVTCLAQAQLHIALWQLSEQCGTDHRANPWPEGVHRWGWRHWCYQERLWACSTTTTSSLLSFQQTGNVCAILWHSWDACLKEQLMDLHAM